MSRDFPESDWRKFRELHEIALERFCERTLKGVTRTSAAEGQTAHQRYLKVYRLIHKRDKELADAFNDPRRSMALLQLMMIVSLKLITSEELASFSPTTQQSVATLLDVGRS